MVNRIVRHQCRCVLYENILFCFLIVTWECSHASTYYLNATIFHFASRKARVDLLCFNGESNLVEHFQMIPDRDNSVGCDSTRCSRGGHTYARKGIVSDHV
jgi:hypothetical protein